MCSVINFGLKLGRKMYIIVIQFSHNEYSTINVLINNDWVHNNIVMYITMSSITVVFNIFTVATPFSNFNFLATPKYIFLDTYPHRLLFI